MNPFEYIPIVAKQHRDELQKQTAQSQQLRAAFPTAQQKAHNTSKFLVMIRKELLYLRFTLEARLNEWREMRSNPKLQSNPEGCQ